MKKSRAIATAQIVLIEDNRTDVFLLERALRYENLRFELVHLPTGSAAVAFIHRQRPYADTVTPDLIIVDMNMARYTGEDILREIHAAEHLSGVPVCVWSSSSRLSREEAVLRDLGISRFITKPCGLDEFMQIGRTIKDLLARHESTDSA